MIMPIPDRHQQLHNMSRRIWDEELLSDEFMFIVEKVLTPKERITAEMKIEGYTSKQIAVMMKCGVNLVYKRITNIRKKFENMCSTKINTLGWKRYEEEEEEPDFEDGALDA